LKIENEQHSQISFVIYLVSNLKKHSSFSIFNFPRLPDIGEQEFSII